MLEKDVERRLVAKKPRAALCFKLRFLCFNGCPDRLILYRGRAFFVEVKSPVGGRLSFGQKILIGMFQRVGFPIFVLCDYEEVDAFINYIEIITRSL